MEKLTKTMAAVKDHVDKATEKLEELSYDLTNREWDHCPECKQECVPFKLRDDLGVEVTKVKHQLPLSCTNCLISAIAQIGDQARTHIEKGRLISAHRLLSVLSELATVEELINREQEEALFKIGTECSDKWLMEDPKEAERLKELDTMCGEWVKGHPTSMD